ncbi:phage major capsid protein [Pleomorphomonas sp. JP5]|uniref:phage major capsid protein n=1 Tax=Pleomorphomonas sp. JP5 TaxID=2942998 RepID=UPI0020447A7D|nr:phage major capsid protein [Pleomorphomonas sp. JP5]MCM5556289.1 phage major capsid protein [Pleomorphomonas sp. JP5]
MHALSKTAGAVGGIATIMSMTNALRGPRICLAPPGEGGEGGGTKSVSDLAAEIKADHQKAIDKVKEIAEKALHESKSAGGVSEKVKETVDEALVKMNALGEQVSTLEQKLARNPGGDGHEVKSLGEQFVESEEYKSFVANSPRSGKASLRVKADITTSDTNAAGSVGGAIAPNRLPGIIEQPRRRLTVRNLLSPGRTDGPLIEYVQEVGFTNNAAPAAEGAKKPQSDIQLIDKQTSTKVIAHFMKASKQALSDVSQLRSLIDSRLLYGLGLEEENQLLNGDGAGQNLHGIIPQATAFTPPVTVAGMTSIDMLRLAMLQAVLAEYPATGHILNPSDWAVIETLKDAQGRYIIGNPQGTTSPTLWNLPVVTTQAIAQDKFLTGAFQMGAQVFDQWSAAIEAGFENDDFTRNKITILAEERLALAMYRPEAFIYGDFGRVAEGG